VLLQAVLLTAVSDAVRTSMKGQDEALIERAILEARRDAVQHPVGDRPSHPIWLQQLCTGTVRFRAEFHARLFERSVPLASRALPFQCIHSPDNCRLQSKATASWKLV